MAFEEGEWVNPPDPELVWQTLASLLGQQERVILAVRAVKKDPPAANL